VRVLCAVLTGERKGMEEDMLEVRNMMTKCGGILKTLEGTQVTSQAKEGRLLLRVACCLACRVSCVVCRVVLPRVCRVSCVVGRGSCHVR
jgi:hypothetical protein